MVEVSLFDEVHVLLANPSHVAVVTTDEERVEPTIDRSDSTGEDLVDWTRSLVTTGLDKDLQNVT